MQSWGTDKRQVIRQECGKTRQRTVCCGVGKKMGEDPVLEKPHMENALAHVEDFTVLKVTVCVTFVNLSQLIKIN